MKQGPFSVVSSLFRPVCQWIELLPIEHGRQIDGWMDGCGWISPQLNFFGTKHAADSFYVQGDPFDMLQFLL